MVLDAYGIYTYKQTNIPYKMGPYCIVTHGVTWVAPINGGKEMGFHFFLSGDMGGPLLTTVVFGAHFVHLR